MCGNGLNGDGTCNWFTFFSRRVFFSVYFSLTLINIYMGKLQWMACGHYDLMVIITEWKQMIKRSPKRRRPGQKRIQTIFIFCFLLFFSRSWVTFFFHPCATRYNYSGIRPSNAGGALMLTNERDLWAHQPKYKLFIWNDCNGLWVRMQWNVYPVWMLSSPQHCFKIAPNEYHHQPSRTN